MPVSEIARVSGPTWGPGARVDGVGCDEEEREREDGQRRQCRSTEPEDQRPKHQAEPEDGEQPARRSMKGEPIQASVATLTQ